jgi:phage terminase large subunit-like protein
MGAPVGNTNAAKAKRWEAAIMRALESWPEKPNSDGCNPLMVGLNEAAHAFVKEMHERKDVTYFKELGDRMDGKSVQQTEITGKDGEPLQLIVAQSDTNVL